MVGRNQGSQQGGVDVLLLGVLCKGADCKEGGGEKGNRQLGGLLLLRNVGREGGEKEDTEAFNLSGELPQGRMGWVLALPRRLQGNENGGVAKGAKSGEIRWYHYLECIKERAIAYPLTTLQSAEL